MHVYMRILYIPLKSIKTREVKEYKIIVILFPSHSYVKNPMIYICPISGGFSCNYLAKEMSTSFLYCKVAIFPL